MNSINIVLVGFIAVLGSVMGQVPKLQCTNSTLKLTRPVNATVCTKALSSTSTTQPGTIYSSSPNGLVPPPIAYLYRFTASVDTYQSGSAHGPGWHAQ